MDICFLVDSSASVLQVNWPKLLGFINDVVSLVDLGPQATQVGLVSFSSTSELTIPLNRFNNTTDLQNAINATVFKQRGTFTHLAFETAMNDCFSSKFGDRGGVADVAYLITDGISRDTHRYLI